MTPEERIAAEGHAADCDRCQALLAAMIATTPEPLTKAPRSWRPALGWLVPLTAAAAAALVWIVVTPTPPVQRQSASAAAGEIAQANPVSAPAAAVPEKAADGAAPLGNRQTSSEGQRSSQTNASPASASAPASRSRRR